jgi:hypothetical protein
MRALLLVALAACGGSGGDPDAGSAGDAPAVDGTANDARVLADRDRLLATYLSFLRTQPEPQTNGLDGGLPDTCALWEALAPSGRDTFLLLAARLEGSRLTDGTTMLSRVTSLYRLVGGEGATATDPGSCGGGEANRIITAIDPELHAALVAANAHEGDPIDLTDAVDGGYWRDSSDPGGTHAPFDLSDETEGGAPRGQIQLFADPTSAAATSPLGRTDLATLVEPYAMEMDHDFDCVHNSNPACEYTLYGPFCAPQAAALGTAIYAATYSHYDPSWRPASCP